MKDTHQWRQVEEIELRAQGFEGGVSDFGALAFDFPGIQAGIPDEPQTFGRNVGNQPRDEIQR
jgi:hypothetical protein